MISAEPKARKVLFVTTLIDLLMQVVFIFILIVGFTLGAFHDITGLKQQTGLSIAQISERWKRLVDIDSLELRGKILAAHEADELKREVSQLTEANARLTKRLGAGGRDYPPCWTGPDGMPEYLLNITIFEEGVTATPAWPERRRHDAEQLGIIEELASRPRLFSDREFSRAFGKLAARKKGCGYYSRVADTKETTKVAYQKHLSTVEDIFYKKLSVMK